MGKRTRATRRLSRHETAMAAAGAIDGDAAPATATGVQAFSFGEPVPVHDRRELLDMAECWHNGRWYEPPVSVEGLARAFRVSPHHSSAMILKRNLLVGSFVPSPWLSRSTFEKLVQDYIVFGFGFLEQRRNLLGGLLRLNHALAKFTRVGVVPGTAWYVPGNVPEAEFAPGSVVRVMQPDVNQEIYGVPEYLSALQSAMLNEAATLFRRKYYLNGSHAGFILYASGTFANNDVEKMREALRDSKGPGNFKNLFLHAPAGAEGGIKIIPISEVGAKDEFLGVKNATRDDVLAAHRVPHQLIGVVPAQGSVAGKASDAVDMFFELEIQPIQARLLDLNEQLGVEAVAFAARAAPPAT